MDTDREDNILSTFLASLGPWNQHVVIGGGYAPVIYKLYLSGGDEGPDPVGTRDIDSLIPRRIKKGFESTIQEHLEKAGFRMTKKDLEDPASEAYSKEIAGVDIEVEFLTDNLSRKDPNRNVTISGVVAQPLRYLEISMTSSVPFTTNQGLQGLVVAPAKWIFHKGLTFHRRKSKAKSAKDLYGIWYVGSQLGPLSKDAVNELATFLQQHPKRFRKFSDNLRLWIENAVPSNWDQLEAQDPYGRLTHKRFVRLVELLTTETSTE